MFFQLGFKKILPMENVEDCAQYADKEYWKKHDVLLKEVIESLRTKVPVNNINANKVAISH